MGLFDKLKNNSIDEEEFNIEFENEDVEKIKTVGDAIEYIKNLTE